MGGFLGIGNSSAKTDRSNVLTGFSDLKNVFNFAMPFGENEAATGQATTKEGLSDLGKSSDYWSKLLSGDRSTMQQAVAPETNAVLSQADAEKRQQGSMGTARGGGVAANNQQTEDASMAKIDNLLFGARPMAAGQEAAIGGKEADIGNSQLAEAMNALGLGERSANDLTGDAIASRKESFAINKSVQSDIQGVIANLAALA